MRRKAQEEAEAEVARVAAAAAPQMRKVMERKVIQVKEWKEDKASGVWREEVRALLLAALLTYSLACLLTVCCSLLTASC